MISLEAGNEHKCHLALSFGLEENKEPHCLTHAPETWHPFFFLAFHPSVIRVYYIDLVWENRNPPSESQVSTAPRRPWNSDES
jgi:hypothetical protein